MIAVAMVVMAQFCACTEKQSKSDAGQKAFVLRYRVEPESRAERDLLVRRNQAADMIAYILEQMQPDAGTDGGASSTSRDVVEPQGARQIRVRTRDRSALSRVEYQLDRSLRDVEIVSRDEGGLLLAMTQATIDFALEKVIDATVMRVERPLGTLAAPGTTISAHGSQITIEAGSEAALQAIQSALEPTDRVLLQLLDPESSSLEDLGPLPVGLEREADPFTGTPSVVARGPQGREVMMRFLDSTRARVEPERAFVAGELRDPSAAAGDAERKRAWRAYLVRKQPKLSANDVEDAYIAFDSNQPYVSLTLRETGVVLLATYCGRPHPVAVLDAQRVIAITSLGLPTRAGFCALPFPWGEHYGDRLDAGKELARAFSDGSPLPMRREP